MSAVGSFEFYAGAGIRTAVRTLLTRYELMNDGLEWREIKGFLRSTFVVVAPVDVAKKVLADLEDRFVVPEDE